LDAELLLACWQDLHKEAASGVDHVTADAYAVNLQGNIEALVQRLKTKRYRAKLVWRCDIPKANGTERPLGIPALEDKLVQLACAKRYGYLVEADIKGFFEPMDHPWLLDMLRLRIDDRALLHRIRTWLKAGIVDTDGQVVHPETGTPQGGTVSPVLANVSLHDALDIWFAKVVKPHCRGEALLCR
jgi:RNA-directed DNA polymerase